MSVEGGITALEEQYGKLALPAAIGLLEWALGSIDELNQGELGEEWGEDSALYIQAREMVTTFRSATKENAHDPR